MANSLCRLYRFVVEHHELVELRPLCQDLRIDYNALAGRGRSGKARELILKLVQQRQLHCLLACLHQAYPDLFEQIDLNISSALLVLYNDLPVFQAQVAPPHPQASRSRKYDRLLKRLTHTRGESASVASAPSSVLGRASLPRWRRRSRWLWAPILVLSLALVGVLVWQVKQVIFPPRTVQDNPGITKSQPSEEWLRQAAIYAPEGPAIPPGLANSSDRNRKARQKTQKAIEADQTTRDPDDTMVTDDQGLAHQLPGQSLQAANQFDDVVANRPEFCVAYLSGGQAYLETIKPDWPEERLTPALWGEICASEDGAPVGWPLVQYLQISQGFYPGHDGVDFSGHTGTPVLATHSGRVIYAGWSNIGYGKLVIIQSDTPAGLVQTYYAHQRVINVAPGQAVERGQQIGQVGSTGSSSGPHLHYEVRVNGAPVNPLLTIPLQ